MSTNKISSKSIVLFMTGPSGAGKSTTAQAWAASRENTCALIDQDHIRSFIKSGFADPGIAWNETTANQWEISRKICIDMVYRYVEGDIDCVIDTFSPTSDFEVWKSYLSDIQVYVVVLLPALETVIARNNQREGTAKIPEDSIRQNHGWMVAWKEHPEALIIDNANKSVEEIIILINDWLDNKKSS